MVGGCDAENLYILFKISVNNSKDSLINYPKFFNMYVFTDSMAKVSISPCFYTCLGVDWLFRAWVGMCWMRVDVH